MSDAALTAESVTVLLNQWRRGDRDALDKLMPMVFTELHRIARARFNDERANHTLQPTALVGELFIRLLGESPNQWRDRAQFYAAMAERMRHLLIDHARRRNAEKRGGDRTLIPLEICGDQGEVMEIETVELLALDQALTKLATYDERKARIVELRYFAGLTLEEAASAMEISLRTAQREWSLARSLLRHEMGCPG